MKWVILCFLPFHLLGFGPFGKDASLVTQQKKPQTRSFQPFSQAILFHQQILSPADGPRSHFYPSSSEYSKQALRVHGLGIGLLLTFDRLMRENNEPWLYKMYILPSKDILKYNPVPKNHR